MPLAELAFVGAATGMALMGLRPVIEMQFADFISSASTRSSSLPPPLTIVGVAPCRGSSAPRPTAACARAPFTARTPKRGSSTRAGLKVVARPHPADAKGLLSAIRDNNPVIYFESKPLYRSLKGYVPAGEYVVPFGKAHVARRRRDLSIISLRHAGARGAHGCGANWRARASRSRGARPAHAQAARRRRDPRHGAQDGQGAGRPRGQPAGRRRRRGCRAWWPRRPSSGSTRPYSRIGGLDTPIPFSPPLEDAYRPDAARIEQAARALAAY
jgi:2-oxoisovalerate dehydrogenase E1 component beta subunit